MSFTTDTPFGLNPVKTLAGGAWNSQYNVYLLPVTGTAISSAFNLGDPVTLTAGYIEQYNAGTGTALILGATVGFMYVDSTGTAQYVQSIANNTAFLAGTSPVAYVVDDPNVIFTIQADGSIPQASCGTNANLVVSTTTPFPGQSAYELSDTPPTAALDNPVKIIRYSTTVETNNSTTAFPIMEVIINNHLYRAGSLS